MCTRTVSTLAHIFEAHGIATVTIGSIREQLYNTRPPRGLFCDFPLGRPLGKPNDAAFQTDVIRAAVGLLASPAAVIQDYPERIEDTTAEVLVCPLPPAYGADVHPAVAEAKGLRGAYDRAISRHGNRAGAARIVDADGIAEAIGAFVKIADGTPWKEAGVPGIPARVAQDIRGYYELAAMELVEHTPAAWAGYRWYRDQTRTGEVIKQAQQAMKAAGVKDGLWRFLLPLDAAPT